MAQTITFWEMTGKSDSEIKTVRLRSKADIAETMRYMPSGTHVVTLQRTDNQSPIVHEIWTAPDYIPLDKR